MFVTSCLIFCPKKRLYELSHYVFVWNLSAVIVLGLEKSASTTKKVNLHVLLRVLGILWLNHGVLDGLYHLPLCRGVPKESKSS